MYIYIIFLFFIFFCFYFSLLTRNNNNNEYLLNRLLALMGGKYGNEKCKILQYLLDIKMKSANNNTSQHNCGSSYPISRYGLNNGIGGSTGAHGMNMEGFNVLIQSELMQFNRSVQKNNQPPVNSCANDYLLWYHSGGDAFDEDGLDESDTNNENKNQNHDNNGNDMNNNNKKTFAMSSQEYLQAAIHYFTPNFSDFPDSGNMMESDTDMLRNSCVRESESINTDMTTSGAILAIGLMYLKTNNTFVSNQLKICNNLFYIDYIRADWVYLKNLCRNVILWDAISPTSSWLHEQMPTIVSKYLSDHSNSQSKSKSKSKVGKDNVFNEIYLNIVSSACMSLGKSCLSSKGFFFALLFCKGMKYAGTQNKKCYHLITHYAKEFLEYRVKGCNVEKYMIELCLALIVISLSLVMSGSGQLKTLKLIRYLQSFVDSKQKKGGKSDISYGIHMMYSMATGFLFLNGGRLTLSTHNNNVGMFTFRMQANTICMHILFSFIHKKKKKKRTFRHLWYLSIENRYLVTVDVDTQRLIPMNVNIEMKKKRGHSKSIITKQTPLILPPLHRIKSLFIYNDDTPKHGNETQNKSSKKKESEDVYWSITLNCNDNQILNTFKLHNGVIYVKKKHTRQHAYRESVNDYLQLFRPLQVLYRTNDHLVGSGEDFSLLSFPWDVKIIDTFYFQTSKKNTLMAFEIMKSFGCYNNSNNTHLDSENEPLIDRQVLVNVKYLLESLFQNWVGNGALANYVQEGWSHRDCHSPQQIIILSTLLKYSEMNSWNISKHPEIKSYLSEWTNTNPIHSGEVRTDELQMTKLLHLLFASVQSLGNKSEKYWKTSEDKDVTQSHSSLLSSNLETNWIGSRSSSSTLNDTRFTNLGTPVRSVKNVEPSHIQHQSETNDNSSSDPNKNFQYDTTWNSYQSFGLSLLAKSIVGQTRGPK
ncbi:anaphase promoting complex subunit 1 [Reticulomyxa filosa]|uniref:Anaphase promoting complex subunit 1 n=1 Tax=Reticulomyxa filosa TaxID=46433 RepID=X6NUA6_RETFI|nr:anaphase promoting complex subunit 1 [Reticulomyxa filosa]|eukprot:ETO29611.1 anaphase promoting complex subunit 1 [Reticulomyxa filosa]